MTIPANAPGLIWNSSLPPDSLPWPPIEIRGANGLQEVRLEYQRIDDDRWLVHPLNGFEVGETYSIRHATIQFHGWSLVVDSTGSWRLPSEKTTFGVTWNEIELRVDDRALDASDLSQTVAVVGAPLVEEVTVPVADGSCWRDISSVVVQAQARLPESLAPFREYLHYETLIDGTPFVHVPSMCTKPLPGQTIHGPALDRLFAFCSEPESLFGWNGISPGTHRLAFRVWLPASDVQGATEEIEFDLDTSRCAGG